MVQCNVTVRHHSKWHLRTQVDRGALTTTAPNPLVGAFSDLVIAELQVTAQSSFDMPATTSTVLCQNP
jgi:hypothetical protein